MSSPWTNGYTQTELDDAQEKFGLVFPPDLVAFLRVKRAVEGYDWRDERAIRSVLEWPLEGILFDVEQNALWWPEWGERPKTPEEREVILRMVHSRAPKLIPLVGNRFLPETPNETGNPVFSVHQADIIYYAANLDDFFNQEFEGWKDWPLSEQKIKRIPFWSDFVERNYFEPMDETY